MPSRADVTSGSAAVPTSIRQYLEAGLVDEFTLSIAPVTLGGGIRLFDGLAPILDGFTAVEAERSPRATHLTYAVAGRGRR